MSHWYDTGLSLQRIFEFRIYIWLGDMLQIEQCHVALLSLASCTSPQRAKSRETPIQRRPKVHFDSWVSFSFIPSLTLEISLPPCSELPFSPTSSLSSCRSSLCSHLLVGCLQDVVRFLYQSCRRRRRRLQVRKTTHLFASHIVCLSIYPSISI